LPVSFFYGLDGRFVRGLLIIADGPIKATPPDLLKNLLQKKANAGRIFRYALDIFAILAGPAIG